MSPYTLTLMVLALVAAIACWGDWRRVGWLAALVVDLAVSVLYWNSGLPYAEIVAAACDAAVVLSIYFWGRYKWELRVVWRGFQLCVLINILYFASRIRYVETVVPAVPHDVYSSLLELTNLAVILFIGGTGILARIDDASPDWAHSWLHRALYSLREKRATNPFTHARRAP